MTAASTSVLLGGRQTARNEPLPSVARNGTTSRLRTSVGRAAANGCYFLAVVAINFTLFRPSPVDILFVIALGLSLISRQAINRNNFLFCFLAFTWTFSMFVSSVNLTDDPEVRYYLLKISFAISIGICSALVASHWGSGELSRFVKVYTGAALVAATLGTAGYLGGIEDLTWDGRAKAFLDDPNMYGAFLIPGVLCCMYLLSESRRKLLLGGAVALLAFGLLLSFSRAAIVSGLIWGTVYYMFLNRHRPVRAGAYLLIALVVGAVLLLVATLSVDGLADRLADRSTLAKSYDLGHDGRYGRYALSVPFILDNPLGLGLNEWDKMYEEPIHNIWVSSFLNYGWLAGFTFTILLITTLAISVENYRATRDGKVVLVSAAWIAVLSCAFLHEAERWRHLWLFTGLIWGLNTRKLASLDDMAAWCSPLRVFSRAPGHA